MDVKSISERIGVLVTQYFESSGGAKSRSELCTQENVSLRTLSRIEAGDPTVSLGSYLTVTNALGLTSISDLFGVDG